MEKKVLERSIKTKQIKVNVVKQKREILSTLSNTVFLAFNIFNTLNNNNLLFFIFSMTPSIFKSINNLANSNFIIILIKRDN